MAQIGNTRKLSVLQFIFMTFQFCTQTPPEAYKILRERVHRRYKSKKRWNRIILQIDAGSDADDNLNKFPLHKIQDKEDLDLFILFFFNATKNLALWDYWIKIIKIIMGN